MTLSKLMRDSGVLMRSDWGSRFPVLIDKSGSIYIIERVLKFYR